MVSDRASPVPAGEPKAKIFISYSRKDMAFVDGLEAALKARGVEPLIDRTDIYAFEDWWRRIEALIARADTIVFVLSPDAVAPGSVCQKEVAFAASLSKRFAPVVCRRVADDAVPDALRRLNWIFFDDEAQFERNADKLAEALATDIDWIRKHTGFGESARRWAAAGRPGPRGLLLRSPVLEEAEHWIAARPEGAPPPIEETQAFILESRRAATRRRNALTGSLAAGLLVALGLATLAYWQWRAGEVQRNEAQVAQSKFLARDSRAATDSGDATLGALLALAALPRSLANPDRPYVTEAAYALQHALLNRAEAFILRHAHPVRAAAFSPDGSSIVTASEDQTARLWDSRTGATIAVLQHEGSSPVRAAAFSPDGTRVATAGGPSPRVWDAKTGALIATLPGGNRVWTVVFSPDGKRVVTAGSSFAIVSDANTGAAIAGMQVRLNMLSAEFSPDGTRVLTTSGSGDPGMRIWNAATGAELLKFGDRLSGISSAVFSPDGTLVAVAFVYGTAQIWNADNGSLVATLRGQEGELTSIRFAPDGARVVTASSDGTGSIWDAKTGRRLAALRGHESAVRSAVFSSDGTRVLTASKDRSVGIWDVQNLVDWKVTVVNPLAILRGHSDEVLSASFSPGGAHVVSASSDGTARLWDITTLRPIATLEAMDQTDVAAFSSDGERVVRAGAKSAMVSEVRTGRTLAMLQGHQGDLRAASFSQDGRRVVTGSEDKTARVWDSETGELIAVLRDEDGATRVALSPDGARVITNSGNFARVWDVKTGAEIAVLRGHEEPVNSVAFSPDGARIVTTALDKTIRLWDANLGSELAVMRGHASGANRAVFSPGGTLVATRSLFEKVVRFWDARSGAAVSVVPMQYSPGYFAFSPDDAFMISDGIAGYGLWDVTRVTLIASLRTYSSQAAAFSRGGADVLLLSFRGTVSRWTLPEKCQGLIDHAAAYIKSIPRDLSAADRARFFLTGQPADSPGPVSRALRFLPPAAGERCG